MIKSIWIDNFKSLVDFELELSNKLKHYTDMRIRLDLVKVLYGKFGGLLTEVKTVHDKAVIGLNILKKKLHLTSSDCDNYFSDKLECDE